MRDKRAALHIVVTSASGKGPLIRAVQAAARKVDREIHVIAADIDPNAPARHIADDFWRMPPAGEEEAPAILEGCRNRRIRVIIPTRDGELAFWARHASELEKTGIHVVVSRPATVERCIDKLAFAGCGMAPGLPSIPTACSPDEITAERYVVKERYGAGSRRIGLNLDREAAIAHARTLEHPIFQPFIPGEEISADAWLDRRHRVKGLVLRRRDVVVSGESRVTTTFRHAGLEEQVTCALESLAARGPVVMQVLIDREGRAYIIECNLRFGGASTAAIAAGLDPFYWSLMEIQGADLAACPFRRIPGEVRQVRLPADTYFYGPDF